MQGFSVLSVDLDIVFFRNPLDPQVLLCGTLLRSCPEGQACVPLLKEASRTALHLHRGLASLHHTWFTRTIR